MKTHVINGKEITVDETLKYEDFYVDGTQCTLYEVDLPGMLEALENGNAKWDDLAMATSLLSRWVTEGPRKRRLRELKRSGINVITGEHLFEEDGGDVHLDRLEAAGKVACEILAAYGLTPLSIENDGPDPVPITDIIDPRK